jgi:hypothetical protein
MSQKNIITKDDLKELEESLIGRFIGLLERYNTRDFKWIKSSEAQKMLNCSSSTLQNLRNSGKIPFAKYGGTLYYNYYDIIKTIEENSVQIHLPKAKFDPDNEWDIFEKVDR